MPALCYRVVMMRGLHRRIAVGAGWMILLRWADRFVGLISIAVLARLLLPADFGLVGYAMVFLAILELFFMFSFETALIRDQEAGADSYNTAWTLELIKGFVLSGIVVLGAKPASIFFNEPQVEIILYWIAAFPIVRGLENIGTVDFQKDLAFHKDFIFRLSVRVIGTIFTIVLAFTFRNFWALVFGNLIQSILRVALSYVMSDYRPRLNLSKFSKIFSFSKWLLIQNIFSGLNERFPVLVIGRYVNAQALAYFNIGIELANLASQELAAPIRRALYPGVAKMDGDPDAMSEAVLATLSIIVLVGLPATIGIGVTAALIVPTLLGENWNDLIPVLQVLTLHAATYVFYNNSHVIYYSQGRPFITARLSILRTLILVPLVLWLVPLHGAVGAAWALAATNWFVIFIDYAVLIFLTPITVTRVLSAIWRSVVSVTLMAAAVHWALTSPTFDIFRDSIVLHLGLCVMVGVISYVSSIVVFWRLSGTPEGGESLVVKLLAEVIKHPLAAKINAAVRKQIH